MPPLPPFGELLITSLPALMLMFEPSPSVWLVLTRSVPPPLSERFAPAETRRVPAEIGLLLVKLIAPSPLAARLFTLLAIALPVSTSDSVAALPEAPLMLALATADS